jgi:hypothetical protein
MRNSYRVEGEAAFIYVRHRGAWYRVVIDVADLAAVRAFPGTWSLIRTSAGLRVKGSLADPRTRSGRTTVYLARVIARARPGTRLRFNGKAALDLRRSNSPFEQRTRDNDLALEAHDQNDTPSVH